MKGQNNFWKQNAFLTCSRRFLTSNKLEQLEFKLEESIGIQKKHIGKHRKFIFKLFRSEVCQWSRRQQNSDHKSSQLHLITNYNNQFAFNISNFLQALSIVISTGTQIRYWEAAAATAVAEFTVPVMAALRRYTCTAVALLAASVAAELSAAYSTQRKRRKSAGIGQFSPHFNWTS